MSGDVDGGDGDGGGSDETLETNNVEIMIVVVKPMK
jgi:hypothetical protein